MWFGDRCRVVVEPIDVSVHDGDLTTVAKAIDALSLEALCAKR
jgi:hypothetical protein